MPPGIITYPLCLRQMLVLIFLSFCVCPCDGHLGAWTEKASQTSRSTFIMDARQAGRDLRTSCLPSIADA